MKGMIKKALTIGAGALIVVGFTSSITALAAGNYDTQAKSDIVDTAVAAGQFTTLAAALEAAGLVSTLKSDGPFTVFAPTDDAFAKLS
jgi:uncharacterized surface protein with fasciclin (FAS1) repeats